MPLNKEQMREYMKKRRAAEKKAEPTLTDEPHPVYPNLKRYSDRTYDENGLVLIEQRCPLDTCKGLYAASIEIPCPYCGGSGKRKYQ
jgi:hypothetical protein